MAAVPILEVRDVTKHYRMGVEVVRALDGVGHPHRHREQQRSRRQPRAADDLGPAGQAAEPALGLTLVGVAHRARQEPHRHPGRQAAGAKKAAASGNSGKAKRTSP